MSRWSDEPDDTGHGSGPSLASLHARHRALANRLPPPAPPFPSFTDWLTDVALATGWRRGILVGKYFTDVDTLYRASVAPADAADELIRRHS